ncbi:MAG TPA: alpha/beta hydrolase [Holophagaceae bacterium]|nr:alpha/beta hydrolase [Holophagaceae bacterium]
MDPRLDQSWRAVPVSWQRRWGRRLFYLILLCGAVVVTGLAYEPVAEAFQLRNASPPGRVVQAAGLDMHMQVAGQVSRPVVVLFDGWGLPSSSWTWVMAQVSQNSMVVRWDPPGYAWSAWADADSDAATQADRIYTAMKTYEVNGPYLLVGSGLGALEARAFAVRHPQEVAGMVLLDPWHQPLMDDAEARAKNLEHEATLRRFSWHRFKAWWQKAPDPDFGLQGADATAMTASLKTMKLVKAQAAELRALPQSFDEVQANQTMEQKPLVILTSAALDKDGSDGPWSPDAQAGRVQMDEQFSKLSTQGKHFVIPNATPTSLICHQNLAEQVTQAIQSCTGG